MTCIVWHKDKLYADSLFYKDNELFTSLTKIQSFLLPFKMVLDRDDFRFDDTIHAWSGTGGFRAMTRFAEWMESEGTGGAKFGTIMSFYSLAAKQSLVDAMTTYFDIFLVGEQYNHTFQLDAINGFSYRRYDKQESVFMGSGHRVCTAFMQDTEDPIRAMLETFYVDLGSGGMIEVWEMTKDPDGMALFRREGLMMDIPKMHLRHFLDVLNPNKNEKIGLHYERTQKQGLLLDVFEKKEALLQTHIHYLESLVNTQANSITRLRKKLKHPSKPAVKTPAVKKVVKKEEVQRAGPRVRPYSTNR
jgi:hypothetical protein